MKLGVVNLLIWIVGLILQASVVFCVILRREFPKYYSICLYMPCSLLADLGLYFSAERLGVDSQLYFYYYYYSDTLLSILLYFVIIHFYEHVFIEMNVNRYIRGAATFLLISTAIFSYLVVHQHQDSLTPRFAVELEQNLNFVGVVLIYLLWGAVLKLRETRMRLVQLILAMGIYFSGITAVYAVRNLFPAVEDSILRWAPPLIGLWLPAAWTYAFIRTSDDQRLLTSELESKATA